MDNVLIFPCNAHCSVRFSCEILKILCHLLPEISSHCCLIFVLAVKEKDVIFTAFQLVTYRQKFDRNPSDFECHVIAVIVCGAITV